MRKTTIQILSLLCVLTSCSLFKKQVTVDEQINSDKINRTISELLDGDLDKQKCEYLLQAIRQHKHIPDVYYGIDTSSLIRLGHKVNDAYDLASAEGRFPLIDIHHTTRDELLQQMCTEQICINIKDIPNKLKQYQPYVIYDNLERIQKMFSNYRKGETNRSLIFQSTQIVDSRVDDFIFNSLYDVDPNICKLARALIFNTKNPPRFEHLRKKISKGKLNIQKISSKRVRCYLSNKFEVYSRYREECK